MGYAHLCRNLFPRVVCFQVVNFATHSRHLAVQIGYAIQDQAAR
jgi:hypothetical protein